jgi:hypothetical protein
MKPRSFVAKSQYRLGQRWSERINVRLYVSLHVRRLADNGTAQIGGATSSLTGTSEFRERLPCLAAVPQLGRI